MFRCVLCPEHSYASKKALNKHDREVHKIFKECVYECNICKENFTSKRKLLKHKTSHRMKNKYTCKYCGKSTSKNNLPQHIRIKHKDVKPIENNLKIYQCYNCESTFSKKSDLISHMQIHKIGHRRLSCPAEGCQDTFAEYKDLHIHLATDHEINIEKEEYTFGNHVEFNAWKTRSEGILKANYVKDTGTRKLKNGDLRTYYICHRSLAPRLKQNPKRSSKSLGTNKIEKTCPSMMVTTCDAQQNISVVFYPTHLGHTKQLGRLRISEEERLKIAGKLAQGVTVDRVLSDIRENVAEGQLDRIHLVEKQDINNILRDFSIGYPTKRHMNDAISVKLWVEAMKKMPFNPVLYFKEQGENHNDFHLNDFILIIMTEFQQNALLKFGKSKICIDGTHGLNQYQFHLYTIMVVDEFGSGVPAAFCFSNRSDTLLFQLFFKFIRNKVGPISADIFMSDDYPAFLNAWDCTMGKVSRSLLCTWHVNRNWIQNSNKIANKEKRLLVLKTLKVLQKEINEEIFLKELNIFTSQLNSDPDTLEFFQYFSRTYLHRTHLWAYCYRAYAGINTNMYLESLHKTIKHFYLQGKKCKRLDKTINALINLVRDKMFDNIIKISKQKNTNKIKKIKASHSKAVGIPIENITCKEDNQWEVLSSTDLNLCYVVKKVSDNCSSLCKLKCDLCQICVHFYKCSCPDNVINFNICKHIHACCIYKNVEVNTTNIVNKTDQNCDINLCDPGLTSSHSSMSRKEEINSKIQVLLGLNNKYHLTDHEANLVSNKLDNIFDIYNSRKQLNFEVKEKVNVLEKIEPQARAFTTHKKRKVLDYPQPSNVETKVIKLALSDYNIRVPIIQSSFDHTY